MATQDIEKRPIARPVNSLLAVLRAHEPELRSLGVEGLSVFGSVARGDDDACSDVDIAVRMCPLSGSGFAYFGRLDDLRERLTTILARKVDLVTEPARNPRLRQSLDAERLVAF